MRRAFSAAFFLSILLVFPASAGVRWDVPKKISKDTVLLGEKRRMSPVESADTELEPEPGEKSYAWRLLDSGNNFLLQGRREEAAIAFARCYDIAGPTRVLAGFKLAEVLRDLGRLDEAVAALEDMKEKYLASTKEFGQASSLRAELEDLRRKKAAGPPPSKLSGRQWLERTQGERMKFILEGMETLRAHGVPLRQSAQKYAFLLDEYFIAHPEAPADDAAKALAVLAYEDDEEARLPIDRWRLDPSWTPPAETGTVPTASFKLTGAQWILLTHNDKMSYVLQAMEALKAQHVPMERSPYAYEYAVDEMFTNKPEWPASDPVLSLATVLYASEPAARDVLEALRLR